MRSIFGMTIHIKDVSCFVAEAFKRWSGHTDVKAEGILREVTLPVIPFKSETKGRVNERI